MARIEAHARALVAATLGTTPPDGSSSPRPSPVPPAGPGPGPHQAPPLAPPFAATSGSVPPTPRAHASARAGRDVVRAEGLPRPEAAPAAPSSPYGPIGEKLLTLLRSTFRLESFRPRQEVVCRAVAGGRDVLLVMPTGAGKSLCYQLPGLARGGTTLVVSPLIALMEDQAAQPERRGPVPGGSPPRAPPPRGPRPAAAPPAAGPRSSPTAPGRRGGP